MFVREQSGSFGGDFTHAWLPALALQHNDLLFSKSIHSDFYPHVQLWTVDPNLSKWKAINMCHTQLCSASLSLIAFCPATRCWEMFPLILSDHPDCESQLCCPVVLKTKNNRSFMCAMHRQHNKGHCSMLWLERNPFAYKSCWYHTNLQQPICLERNLILRASWMKSVSQPRAIGCIVMTFCTDIYFPSLPWQLQFQSIQ